MGAHLGMGEKYADRAYYTDRIHICHLKNFLYAVLSLASGHLSHAFGIPWLCFFAWLAEYWAKQKMQLPISAIHQQKSTAKVCQMRETGGQKASDSTVVIKICPEYQFS